MFDLFIYNLVGKFKNALISKRRWKLVMFDNKVKYFKIRVFRSLQSTWDVLLSSPHLSLPLSQFINLNATVVWSSLLIREMYIWNFSRRKQLLSIKTSIEKKGCWTKIETIWREIKRSSLNKLHYWIFWLIQLVRGDFRRNYAWNWQRQVYYRRQGIENAIGSR